MVEEIGVEPLEVWGSLLRPVVSLKLDNVYSCVGYIGHVEDINFRLSQNEVLLQKIIRILIFCTVLVYYHCFVLSIMCETWLPLFSMIYSPNNVSFCLA